MLENKDGQSPNLVYRSPMGTGKTAMMLDYYTKVDTTSSVLWFLTRRTYADNMAAKLEKAGFRSYLDPTKPAPPNSAKNAPPRSLHHFF
jgi:hypothetical protein